MSVRRCLALFFFLTAIARAVRAPARLRHQTAGLLAAARRLVGADIAATVPVVGRDEFTALEEKLNELSQQLIAIESSSPTSPSGPRGRWRRQMSRARP